MLPKPAYCIVVSTEPTMYVYCTHLEHATRVAGAINYNEEVRTVVYQYANGKIVGPMLKDYNPKVKA